MKLIRTNFLVFTVFLGLTIMLSLPHIFRYLTLGSKYTTLIISGPAVTPLSWEETYTYATEANRIKNNQPINDTYIYEYRNKPSPLLSELVPSGILGLPAKFLSLPLVFILAKIIILPTTILIWYLIARQIGYSKTVSVVASLTSLILQKLFVYIPYFSKLSSYEFNGYLESQRVYFPLISSLVTAITIFLIIKTLKSKKSIAIKIFCGLFLGSLFFTYFFAWVLIWIAFLLLLLTLLVVGKREAFKKLAFVALIGLLIGLPYFINIIKFSQNPAHIDFILRTISFPITDWNIPIIFRFLAFFTVITFLGKNWLKNPDKRLLIFIYLTATFLPLVSKIIFQADNQTDHWYERFLYPLSTFLFVLFAADIKHLDHRIKNFIFLTLMLLAILKLDISIYNEIKRPSEYFTIGTPRLDLYHWMANNLPKDSVVASLSFTEQVYLTAYTPFYAYIPQAYKTITPKLEILNRYVNLAKFFGVSNSFITQTFIMPDETFQNPNSTVAKDGNAFMMLYGIVGHFDVFPYPYHKQIQSQVISKLSQEVSWQGRVNYILFGPLEQENAVNFYQKKCKLQYNNGVYQIYKFDTCLVI